MSVDETNLVAERSPEAIQEAKGEVATCPFCLGSREIPVPGSDDTQACTECFGVGEVLKRQSG
ncbi:hypothetical protein [Leisingera aquaemixtae]|uniref:hypothetical protein n=1 Tax=Leisingera aquaemixtae TaxID=1396826 RepID=UPI0011AE7AA7|nr:hypothetical protein [Leisingera aquaemixtae]